MPTRQRLFAIGKAIPYYGAVCPQQETVYECPHTHSLCIEHLYTAHQFSVLDLIVYLQNILIVIAVRRDNI